MTATLLDDATQARVVAAYLKSHPDFFSDYPELAAQLTMPREDGPVSSLAIYQLQSLREKNSELEQRLVELVAIATENESLMERVHALTVALLRANTMEVTGFPYRTGTLVAVRQASADAANRMAAADCGGPFGLA
jgi:uncharacterized protein YigA (DUF484 family)